MKGKWLTYIFVMIMIVGCADNSVQKDPEKAAILANGIYSTSYPSPVINQTVQVAEDFPNISVHVSVVLDFKKDNKQFIDINRGRLESEIFFCLSDTKLDDFRGSKKLKELSLILQEKLNLRLGLFGTSNEISKVWLTRVDVKINDKPSQKLN